MATSKTLQELQDQLQNASYTALTSEQMQAQAENEYQSYYDQLRLAAQQQSSASDLALQHQRTGIQGVYDKQRDASAKQYADNYAVANRQALSRGLQRSSYNNQTLSNINIKGNEAQQALYDQQASAEKNVDEQRTQLASMLAAQLSQYDASQASDVLNRIRELEDQEYTRTNAAQQYNNSLAQQIYQFMYQEQQDLIAQQQWQAEFDENKRQFEALRSSGGGGGGGGGGGRTSGSSGQTKPNMTYQDLVNALKPSASPAKPPKKPVKPQMTAGSTANPNINKPTRMTK